MGARSSGDARATAGRSGRVHRSQWPALSAGSSGAQVRAARPGGCVFWGSRKPQRRAGGDAGDACTTSSSAACRCLSCIHRIVSSLAVPIAPRSAHQDGLASSTAPVATTAQRDGEQHERDASQRSAHGPQAASTSRAMHTASSSSSSRAASSRGWRHTGLDLAEAATSSAKGAGNGGGKAAPRRCGDGRGGSAPLCCSGCKQQQHW